MSAQEYRSIASCRAAAPSASRRGSSSSRAETASASAPASSGGTATEVSGVITSRYPGMSEATTGVAQANARVSTMPKLSPPSDGAMSALAEASSRGQILLAEEAEHVDAVVGNAQPRAAEAVRRAGRRRRCRAGPPCACGCRARRAAARAGPSSTHGARRRPRDARGRPARRLRGSARRSERSRTRPEASAAPRRVPARRRRSADRGALRGSPRPASPAASSRGRRSHGACRPSGRPTTRAPRCRASASSARAGAAGRSPRSSSTRRMRRIDRGLRMMFGSEPFAGTITERPIGITSGGGSPCRPTRGWSTRVN